MPLSQEEQIKYKALYLQTARNYVKELEVNLTYLQGGKEVIEPMTSLHRAAHSLASQSTMMSYQSMSSVTSLMEKIFEGRKAIEHPFSQEEIMKLIEISKHLSVCLDQIDKTNQEADLTQDVEILQPLTKILE